MKNIFNNPSFISSLGAIKVVNTDDSLFGESVVSEKTPLIELNSAYGTSAIRDKTTTTNSGTITSSNGELLLSTGATASSQALLESNSVGRYVPGFAAQVGIGIRIPTAPSGNLYAQWGGWSVDQADGIYFKYDSTGISVNRERGGTVDQVYQSNWNIDTFDGTGPSGVTLDVTEGKIFEIKFSWYGYGSIVFGVIETVSAGDRIIQRFLPCHVFRNFSEVSIKSPNLRVFAEANNGGDATDFDIYVGGRQYSIQGKYSPSFRFSGQTRTTVSVSTTVLPLVSFRFKSAFKSRSVKIDSYEILNNGTNDGSMQIRLDGSLTGASWITPTNHTAAETALEADISATAITGGVVIYSGDILAAGKGQTRSLSTALLKYDIPEDSTVTLCARTFSGSSNMKSALRMREEW